MPEWLVRLKGHEFDLEELSDHFTSTDRNVKKDEDGYYYVTSEDFNRITDSDAVHKRALELIEHMNGAATYHAGGNYRPVEFDGLAQIDESGQPRNFVFLSGVIEGRSRITAKLTVGDQDSTDDAPQPPGEVAVLVNLADQNEKVADALRFYQRGDWINLFKAWEIVCDDARGSHIVVKNGWAVERDRNRFTGTAQSRGELGDEARHASERYKAPKDPMTLNEARAFVRSVIRAWVGTI
jgi:hypothetical protein